MKVCDFIKCPLRGECWVCELSVATIKELQWKIEEKKSSHAADRQTVRYAEET